MHYWALVISAGSGWTSISLKILLPPITTERLTVRTDFGQTLVQICLLPARVSAYVLCFMAADMTASGSATGNSHKAASTAQDRDMYRYVHLKALYERVSTDVTGKKPHFFCAHCEKSRPKRQPHQQWIWTHIQLKAPNQPWEISDQRGQIHSTLYRTVYHHFDCFVRDVLQNNVSSSSKSVFNWIVVVSSIHWLIHKTHCLQFLDHYVQRKDRKKIPG